MFSTSKHSEPQISPPPPIDIAPEPPSAVPSSVPATPRAKSSPSVLSADLTITGNIKTSGDVQVEGVVEGDIRAARLTVGETATIKGEVVAEEVIVDGRVVGRVRGIKVRLSGSARVEGDIIHKMIAIESGAHFEGTVQRQEDPVGRGQSQQPRLAASNGAPGKEPAREPAREPAKAAQPAE